MSKHSVVAIVVIDNKDNRLALPADTGWHQTMPGAMRDAVLAALPGTSRVVAVMPEDEARLMLAAHCIALEESDKALSSLIKRHRVSRRLH